MEMELGRVLVTDPKTKYSYRAVIENLIHYNKLIADTRLLAEGWKKDMATHYEVTNPAGENRGVTARTASFARSRVLTLIGRPHLDIFHQEKLIPSNIDLKLKLIPNRCAYLLKSIAPDDDHPQVNYKFKITEAPFFIRTNHISPSLILGQETVLQTNNSSIPLKKVITKTITIHTGNRIVGFVYNKASKKNSNFMKKIKNRLRAGLNEIF